MKKIIYLFFFFIVSSVHTIGQSNKEKEVAAVVEELNTAMISADKNKLEKLTANELSYGHSNGKVENKIEFVETLVNSPTDFLSIDISDQHITLAGDNAIVRQIFSAKLTNNKVPSEIKIATLLVWKKQKGQWKLLARQGYKI